jgi:hypothetical protein
MEPAHDLVHGGGGLPRQTHRRFAPIRFGKTEQNESDHGNRRLKLLANLVPSVPEIRSLLARILFKPTLDLVFILGWSLWRRRHQDAAAQAHYRKRQ